MKSYESIVKLWKCHMNDDSVYNFKEDKKEYIKYAIFIGAIVATTFITIIW